VGRGRLPPRPEGQDQSAPPIIRRRTAIGIIAFIILGLIAGYIARAIVPGANPGGIIITCLVGIAGALIGGFLASAIFDAHPLDDFFDISTWLTAIVGSVILLWIYRAVAGSGNRGRRLV
jgi:uncharacterized membrane protein YeaQ/YmgE (transglycosylase-associated protein family)